MLQGILFSHRICGINPPPLHSPCSTQPTALYTLIPSSSSFFNRLSSFNSLTLHQPLCVSSLWGLMYRCPSDNRGKPSLFWMCQDWLGLRVSLYTDAKRCLLPSVTGTFLNIIIKWEFYLLWGRVGEAWSAPAITCYVCELSRFKEISVLSLGDRHHNRLRRQNPPNVDRQGHRFLL